MERKYPEKLKPLFFKPENIRHVLIEGGRGGGKSHTIAEYLLIIGMTKKLRILCGREVQKSLKDSVHTLLSDKIDSLRLPYIATQNSIKCLKTGTEFLFTGLKDHTVNSIKSFEGIDIFWGEEAQAFSKKSLDILIPTIRKEGSYFIWSMNRFEEQDPIYDLLIHKNRKDVLHLVINYPDNPHCPDEIKTEAEICKINSPDDYEHIWLGQPMTQGDRCILSRALVRQAMDRTIKPEGAMESGIDVARFGSDTTQFYKRHGLKVIAEKQMLQKDTVDVSNEAHEFINGSSNTKVDDTGVGGGVSDQLIHKGDNITMINFGGSPKDKDKYPNTISEMWFEFKELLESEEVDLPDDRELLQQLTSRQYKFDTKGRRMVESKDDFKKRYGKSPDKADALLLCFYNAYSTISVYGF